MKFRSSVLGLCVLSFATLSAANASKQKSMEQPPKPMGVTDQPMTMVTPPDGPRVRGGANFFVTADFIYWRNTGSGSAYALSGLANVGADGFTPSDPSKKGKVANPDFDFQPGFKVGAGLKFAHDGWDLYANYTWVSPTTTKSSLSDPTGHMYGGDDPYFGSVTVSKASTSYKQKFNVLDLELGRNFFLSRFLTLRPYFGLKGSKIDQNQTSSFTVFNDLNNGINADDDVLLVGSVDNLQQTLRLKSWGIGVRGGIAPVWYFMKDFGLYGNLAVSGMWISYENNAQTTYDGTISGTTGNVSETFHDVTPVIELGLGLVYTQTFYDDTYRLSLSAGWEEQMWVGFNDNFADTLMTLQGFTFKAGFEF